jgi:sugar/nucleoside kinase (ribokinase family)
MVKDRLPDGELVPGGPALYCGRAALALGASVSVVTHLPAGLPAAAVEGLHILGPRTSIYPVFENTYAGGTRSQVMTGESIRLDGLLASRAAHADVLLCAPIYREISGWPEIAPRVRAVSLQGVLRDRDANNRVVPRGDALEAAMGFAGPGAIASFSDEDCADPGDLARALSREGMMVTLTHGEAGATLYVDGEGRDYAAIPGGPAIDPTGAGDCFATAFVVRFAETGNLEEAMTWGLAAGSIAIERPGLLAVANRDELRQRIAGRAA